MIYTENILNVAAIELLAQQDRGYPTACGTTIYNGRFVKKWDADVWAFQYLPAFHSSNFLAQVTAMDGVTVDEAEQFPENWFNKQLI